MESSQYELIESGDGRKLERFGSAIVDRPCAVAVWPRRDPSAYSAADLSFARDSSGRGNWRSRREAPNPWRMTYENICWNLRPNDFGHLGIFPEQQENWRWIAREVMRVGSIDRSPEVLNLFGYTGGSTLAAAAAGASVCHVDASKTSTRTARENAEASGLSEAPVRWIVEDALLFVDREIRRGRRYDGVILDPPSYGRGRRGEVWQLEELVMELLGKCREVMTDSPSFFLLTGHSPGFTPQVLANLVNEVLPGEERGTTEAFEMTIPAGDGRPLPSGAAARWSSKVVNR